MLPFCRVWRMAHVCVILLLLCCTILQAADADDVVGVVGEDVVLPCSIKSTSAKNMQVIWYRGTNVEVHKYMNQEDNLDQQHPDYRGRTSLFKEELKNGSTSLKITSVRLSDMDKYTCLILGQSGAIDTQYVHLKVEAVGSTPNITAKSLGDGSVDLICESTGWTFEPEMEWRDSSGQSLQTEPTMFQRFPEGYRVVRRITVERSNGIVFCCIVWSQIQSRETEIKVPEGLFDKPSTVENVVIATFSVLVLAVIIGILSSRDCCATSGT